MTKLTRLTKELDPPWFESYLYTERGGGEGGGEGTATVTGRNSKRRKKTNSGDKFITQVKKVLLLEIWPQSYYQHLNTSPDKPSRSSETPLKLDCFLATVFDGRHTLTCLFYPSTLSEAVSSIKTPVLLKLIKHKPKLFEIPSTLLSSSEILNSLNLRSPEGTIACLLIVKKARVMDSIQVTGETDGNQLTSMFSGKPWISRNVDVLELWKDDATDIGLNNPLPLLQSNLTSSTNSTDLDPTSISHPLPLPPPPNGNTFPSSFWVIPPNQLQQLHQLLATLPGWSNSNPPQPNITLPTSPTLNTNPNPSPPSQLNPHHPLPKLSKPPSQTAPPPTTPTDYLSDAICLWEEEWEDLTILLS